MTNMTVWLLHQIIIHPTSSAKSSSANWRITSAQLLVLLVVDENLLIIVKDGLAVWSEPLELGWGLGLANLITSEEVTQCFIEYVSYLSHSNYHGGFL